MWRSIAVLATSWLAVDAHAAFPPPGHDINPVTCNYTYIRLAEDAEFASWILPIELAMNVLLWTLVCNPDGIEIHVE